ncbi:MAG: FimV/HubP family polar landmark protein [Gammaproteobacteria bacterium]
MATTLLLLATPTGLLALGLGDIDMQSALNQPMRASIELTSAASEDLSELDVSIASQEAHKRAGLSRASILGSFSFNIDKGSDGQPVIRVTSRDPVREPFLEFLLQLEWPNGRLMRQYTVLVDPPVTMPATPAIPAPPVARIPAPVVETAPAPERVPEPAPALSEVATPTPPATARPAPAARPPAEPAPAPVDTYGPIKRSETLWEIARQVRPGSDITMDQMMIALQRANPHAFIRENINNLRTDVTLRIPDRADIQSLSPAAARAEAQRQYAEWKEARQQPLAAAPVEPAASVVAEGGDAVAEDAGTAEVAMETEARLQLVAPEGEAVEGAATTGDPSQAADETATADADLQQQLILATEEAEAGRAQSEELQTRVSELEEQITTMKRLLELKDDQLASMQQQLGLGTEEIPLVDETAIEGEEPAVAAEAGPEIPAADMETGDQPSMEGAEALPAEEETAADTAMEEASPEQPDAAATVAAETGAPDEPRGIVNRVMDNPVLAGLGVLVAILLGGFLWASTRQRESQGMFDDEPTLEKYLAEEASKGNKRQAPVFDVSETASPAEPEEPQGEGESDPITEADVYLAYGRTRQAEEVLQNALQESPEDIELGLKLLEFYHDVGNVSAFENLASTLHEQLPDDDPRWQRVATLGMALDPGNELYAAEASGPDQPEAVAGMSEPDQPEAVAGMSEPDQPEAVAGMSEPDQPEEAVGVIEPDQPEEVAAEYPDTTGQEALGEAAVAAEAESADEAAGAIEKGLSEVLEFTRGEQPDAAAAHEDEEELTEGLLGSSDEVSTKLDLARAYIDMGDPEGARSILEEVMEEGGADQKSEAESLISKLA